MWNTRKFEDQMHAALQVALGAEDGDVWYATYQTTRTRLLENIYSEIKGADATLSDHGPDHIRNVLDNVYFLLAENGSMSSLSGIELYIVGMTVLFHDVGNLYGRANHHKKIAEVFDWARGVGPSIRREKTLVIAAARAHTGKASDGSYDTLKDVGNNEHLHNHTVRLQELAAILRLADELAEGPQRTSEFMVEKKLYTGDAAIYHDYASVTNVYIDRGTERILLTYELEIGPSADPDWPARVRTFIDFIYKRVIKLDQERRYTRFYSTLLTPFKATSVQFNFHCDGQVLDIFSAPIKLDDKVIPGDPTKSLPDIDTTYNVDAVIEKIEALTSEVQP